MEKVILFVLTIFLIPLAKAEIVSLECKGKNLISNYEVVDDDTEVTRMVNIDLENKVLESSHRDGENLARFSDIDIKPSIIKAKDWTLYRAGIFPYWYEIEISRQTLDWSSVTIGKDFKAIYRVEGKCELIQTENKF